MTTTTKMYWKGCPTTIIAFIHTTKAIVQLHTRTLYRICCSSIYFGFLFYFILFDGEYTNNYLRFNDFIVKRYYLPLSRNGKTYVLILIAINSV